MGQIITFGKLDPYLNFRVECNNHTFTLAMFVEKNEIFEYLSRLILYKFRERRGFPSN